MTVAVSVCEATVGFAFVDGDGVLGQNIWIKELDRK